MTYKYHLCTCVYVMFARVYTYSICLVCFSLDNNI